MRALRVGTVRSVVVASPAYLERRGAPKVPQEVLEHSVIASSAGNFGAGWRFSKSIGEHPLKVQPRLTVTTNDAAVAAAVEGFGMTRLLSYQVAGEIEAGQLEILLADFEPPPSPVHIVHREGRYSSAKVRAFIDLMAERLRADKALNP